MKCPVCNVDLLMTVRESVEIDYCPQCRGVWLDRGELDKIIEKSSSVKIPERSNEQVYMDKRKYDDDYQKDYKYHKKRKGLLGELFDF